MYFCMGSKERWIRGQHMPVLAIADAVAAHAWTQPAASASASPLTVQLGTISIELSVDVALALRDAPWGVEL